MARDTNPRVKNAEKNENTGSAAKRVAAIKARGVQADIRRGGTGRSQRQLGHVKGK
jgi:hypothetical protein